jgi:membrane-bound serine protease (ClpP class)
MKAASFRVVVIIACALGMALAVVMLGARAVAGTSSPAVVPESPGTSGAVKASELSSHAAVVLEIKGAIGPATSHYVVRGIESAEKAGSPLIILEMDTPGGLDSAMRDIIRAILASPIPVVTYVAPSGARAASAGTYILYASHIAAMAPATNLGAATPVSIGGSEPAPEPNPTSPNPTSTPGQAPNPTATPTQAPGAAPNANGGPNSAEPTAKPHKKSGEKTGPNNATPNSGSPGSANQPSTQPPAQPQPSTAMERKVVNDAVAYIRSLAELRGRNAEWAEQAVRGAASLSATAALKEKVIDLIAPDIPDLLTQLNGREVKFGDRAIKLATRDLPLERMKPDWRTELLAVITNPTIAYGLMLIGIYGLLFEGYNPGAVFPGVVGVICLLLALFAFQVLSVNYAGLALVVLGVGMIIAEFFFPAFGSLGLGGLIAFVVGSLILFDTDVPGMNIALPLIGAIATVGGLIIVGIAYIAARSLRRPIVTGVQGMIGDDAEVVQSFTGVGRVRYRGELWTARTSGELLAGQKARIVKVEGLTLWVEPS